jgi:hypothetical protein|tara:strand:+ start:169 stop:372 length:204 start_codon:yes stop_codon:yes gene_type:complete
MFGSGKKDGETGFKEQVIDVTGKSRILWIHSQWLKDNGYVKEYIDCLEQALNYDPHEDIRQLRWGKK